MKTRVEYVDRHPSRLNNVLDNTLVVFSHHYGFGTYRPQVGQRIITAETTPIQTCLYSVAEWAPVVFLVKSQCQEPQAVGFASSDLSKIVLAKSHVLHFLPYLATKLSESDLREVIEHVIKDYISTPGVNVDLRLSLIQPPESGIEAVIQTLRATKINVEKSPVIRYQDSLWEARICKYFSVTDYNRGEQMRFSPFHVLVLKRGSRVMALTPVMHPFVAEVGVVSKVCTGGKEGWEEIRAIIEHPKIDRETPFHCFETVQHWFDEHNIEYDIVEVEVEEGW